jgi:hypothetical protein
MKFRVTVCPHCFCTADSRIECTRTQLLPLYIPRITYQTLKEVRFIKASFKPLKFMYSCCPCRDKWTALCSATPFVAYHFMDWNRHMLEWNICRGRVSCFSRYCILIINSTCVVVVNLPFCCSGPKDVYVVGG